MSSFEEIKKKALDHLDTLLIQEIRDDFKQKQDWAFLQDEENDQPYRSTSGKKKGKKTVAVTPKASKKE